MTNCNICGEIFECSEYCKSDKIFYIIHDNKDTYSLCPDLCMKCYLGTLYLYAKDGWLKKEETLHINKVLQHCYHISGIKEAIIQYRIGQI
mgnify:CR=1 FL=1